MIDRSFSTLLDIDKLTPVRVLGEVTVSFSTLLDIDKLTPGVLPEGCPVCFSTLLDIDKLTLSTLQTPLCSVLVLCWILIMLL